MNKKTSRTTCFLLVVIWMTSVWSFVVHNKNPTRGVFFSGLNRETTTAVPTFRSASATWVRRLHARREKDDDYDDFDEEDDDEEEEETDIDLSDKDWRTFRAKLVMGESSRKTTTSTSSTEATSKESEGVVEDNGDLDGIGALFSSETEDVWLGEETRAEDASTDSAAALSEFWAYDSGKVIEQGAVILGGVEQDFGFGLRQQYFHKAAILVLDHDDSTFTKGIILNRPTEWTLEDELNDVSWKVWFGGDVQGLASFASAASTRIRSSSAAESMMDIVCLHSLKDPQVTRASIPVMKDIQWTTFDNAKRLVHLGAANVTDFWVFCGYAGWGPGQLMGELDRQSWYMVATDSQTLLQELAKLSRSVDPRDAGLQTWTMLMERIGRGETAQAYSGDTFDDLMLKEWALRHLTTEGHASHQTQRPPGVPSTQDLMQIENPIDRLLSRVSSVGRDEELVTMGSLLRASSAGRSPFLLDNQEYHKSIVLVIKDDEVCTVGVILNRPAAKSLDISITDQTASLSRGASQTIQIPLRYGGPYVLRDSSGPNSTLLWLHCHPVLQAAKIGAPVGPTNPAGIWKCTADDVVDAIGNRLAKPQDFLVVSGVSVWTKGERGIARGLQGEVRTRRFNVINSEKIPSVWETLLQQPVLTNSTLGQALELAKQAWICGAASDENSVAKKSNGKQSSGKDDHDDGLVFNSEVKVSKLSDDALRSWVATFMLGAPTLRGDEPE